MRHAHELKREHQKSSIITKGCPYLSTVSQVFMAYSGAVTGKGWYMLFMQNESVDLRVGIPLTLESIECNCQGRRMVFAPADSASTVRTADDICREDRSGIVTCHQSVTSVWSSLVPRCWTSVARQMPG